MKKSILIIEEDLNVCKEIQDSIQSETTEVRYAHTAKEALIQFSKKHFCLVILSLHLSEIDGILLLETIRNMSPVPILVLSYEKSSQSKIAALRSGASGYLEKPYDLEECLAHAQSLMRLYSRLYTGESCNYTLAFSMDLIIDPEHRQATLKGKSLNLTRKEFDLLFCLAEHAGQVLTREQLYTYV